VFVACLVPLARLFALGWLDALGANPVEFVTRSTGTWTLVMLCATLAVTPLRRATGLFAFFYACLHLLTYVWFDQWFDALAILVDVAKRPFVTVGMTAFVLMLPLAATSTNAMMRRLGRRWVELHRLVYLIAPLAILHFWWHKSGKNDIVEPAIYAVIVALLLAMRLLRRARGGHAGRRRSSA
jgi:sulfoxide reductase heme-binding subunit YedZ